MEFVKHESKQGISYIYLNRPETYNALNECMLKELLQTVKIVEENNDKIVILTGAGSAFCSGGDMQMLEQSFNEQSAFDEVMDTIESIVLHLYRLPKVTISAVKGSAAGLGLSLALATDYVVAEEQAKLGMLFLGVGLVPDGGSHFWLKERMGSHHATQFIWSMKQLHGEAAVKQGLVDYLTSNDALEDAKELAVQLLESPLQAMIKTKLAYHSNQEEELNDYLDKERQAQWELKNTQDHQEGVTAFLEKRRPIFKGE